MLAEATKSPEMRRLEGVAEILGQRLAEVESAVNALSGRVDKVPGRIPKPERPKDYTQAIDDLKMLIARIPGAVPKTEIPDYPDYAPQLAAIAERVANIRIPAPEKADLSGIQSAVTSLEQGFDDVLKAIGSIQIPEYEKDEPSKWRFNLVYSDIDGQIEEIIAEPI